MPRDMPKKNSPAYNKLVERALGDAEETVVPYWRDKTALLMREIDESKGLPASEPRSLHNFLRWPTVVSSMFVGTHAPTNLMLGWLNDKWLDAARETFVGNPQPHGLDEGTSGQFVYQAYHLQLLEESLGVDVADLGSIREFGGGYGSMAVVARQGGFRGKYEIVDLPAVIRLQKYYLPGCGIKDVTSIGLDEASAWPADLVIGLCSISETTLSVRDKYLQLTHGSQRYLLRYGALYEGISNVTYFETKFPSGHVILHPITGGPPGHRILIYDRQ